MNCNSKTMIKLAIGLGIALAVAYFTLPEAKAFILASAPILVALICPLAMLFMMKGMTANKKDGNAAPDAYKATSGAEKPTPTKLSDQRPG